jgi:lysophospholipase L1-like esterase
MKYSTKLLLILVLCFSAFSPMAFADSKKDGKHLLVALGDSITFGYNIDLKNQQPSPFAFPALIAKAEHLRLQNFGVPGDNSTQLLVHLSTEAYKEALRNAEVVTLDIGNNDLLQGAASVVKKLRSSGYTPTPEDIQLLMGISASFAANLDQIITQIRALTDAPIVIYTIYNPFYGADEATKPLLAGVNSIIASYAKAPSVVVADAYSAFAGKQNALVLPYDIHPTIFGQVVLAKLGVQAIETLDREEHNDRNDQRVSGDRY